MAGVIREIELGFPVTRASWIDAASIRVMKYECGYCDARVAADRGWETSQGLDSVYICPQCGQPTYFGSSAGQVPRSRVGRNIANLPGDVEDLYGEARDCMQVSAHTCAVLACRKLLLHIAVDKGANAKSLTFIDCIDFLEQEHYLPRDGRQWVDRIRKRGNEANHEIVSMERSDAETILKLVEMLLTFVYEYADSSP